MSAHPFTLIWEGRETIEEAGRLIAQRSALELQLPPDTHFALFSHLCGEQGRSQPETLDLDGGAELVRKAAEVSALKDLEALVPTLQEAGARVHIISPSPAIQIEFPED